MEKRDRDREDRDDEDDVDEEEEESRRKASLCWLEISAQLAIAQRQLSCLSPGRVW